jgi:hypothetical protein
MAFQVTHVAGRQGAPTWPAPDPSAPPGPRLDPGVPVQGIEPRGDWWLIRCENGWEAWTDGRWMEAPRAGGGAAAAALPTPVRTLAAIGAALCAASAWMPWYSFAGTGVDGWDLYFLGLLRDDSSTDGPKVGLIVLLSVVAAIAALVRIPPGLLLVCAAPAVVATGTGLYRWMDAPSPKPDLGLGLLGGAAGAVCIVAAAIVGLTARPAP